MNFVLYVHDPTLVWDPEALGVQGAVAAVRDEIADLLDSYTMGRVTVDVVLEEDEEGEDE